MLEDPARKVVVVDVRLPEEVAVSTLPGVLTAGGWQARWHGVQVGGQPAVGGAGDEQRAGSAYGWAGTTCRRGGQHGRG